VRVDVVSEHNFFAGLSRDISEGGLFVATDLAYDVGERVEIQLRFPGDDAPTSLVTEVAWVRAHSAGGDAAPGLGLRFVEPTEPTLERIRGFMALRRPIYVEL
jgi:uncharacterized protein (TIGR02266 family)